MKKIEINDLTQYILKINPNIQKIDENTFIKDLDFDSIEYVELYIFIQTNFPYIEDETINSFDIKNNTRLKDFLNALNKAN